LLLLPQPDLVSGGGIRRQCLVQTPIVGQTPDAQLAVGVVARIAGATPWKRFQALSGAFNASGSDLADPLQLVPRSGKGQARNERSRR
jgi:hypothetical protein